MSIRFTFVDVEAGANIVIARKSALVSRNDELGYRLSTVGVTISEEEVAMSDIGTVVHSDPDILGGTPVFHGTRVPFRNLIDYLERGYSVEEFLDAFPSVTREQVITSLEAAHEALSVRARSAR